MKRFLVFAVVVVLAAIFAAPVEAAGKVKWSCNTKAATITCSLDGCGVATSEPGKLSLWATSSVNGMELFHFIQLSNGKVALQQWTDLKATGKPISENLKIDVFRQDCVADQQLMELPPKIQEQFMGMYDIPEPISAVVPEAAIAPLESPTDPPSE